MSLPQVDTTAAPFPVAGNLPYQYPVPTAVVGSAVEVTEKTPKIFTPLKVANLTLPNRIGVSPMCQYAAEGGYATDHHKIHYGSFTTRGPGLVMLEATQFVASSGCSPSDLSLAKDSQAHKLKEIVDFAHANTSVIGIQIGHGGRKANGAPLFQSLEDFDARASKSDTVGPSPVPYRPKGRYPTPRELTVAEIKDLTKAFGAAVKRARDISGFDFVEIHAAHGYLINNFLSAHSNKRTDQYGGSFENRIRFLVEIIEESRKNVPEDFPLFVRISADELSPKNPDAWTIEDSVKLAPILVEKGISLIDVSAGANDSNAERRPSGFGFQVEFAKKIKEAVGNTALVAAVGDLSDSKKTNAFIEEGAFDLALIGRLFLDNPGLVVQWAKELDVKIHRTKSHWHAAPPVAEFIEYLLSLSVE